MLIAGINAYHGDASAAALVDGRLIAAAEEERFTRIKHTAGFPAHALRYVIEAAGGPAADLRILAVARDPWARISSKLWRALRMPGHAMKRMAVQGKFANIAEHAAEALGAAKGGISVYRVEHHKAHLASSFFFSPFDEAALLSVDGMGDFASAAWGVGRGNRIHPMGAVTFPHSLGIFYTAFTQYLGFPKYGDEYKVMGLASYGEPEYMDEFRKVVTVPGGGRMDFRLALEYFTHHRSGAEMTWNEGEPALGRLYSDYMVDRFGASRESGENIAQRHCNIAASLQLRLEEVLIDRLRGLHRATGLRRLCMAGGVAFNCVANGKITRETGFDEVYVQPAAGDAGLAVGAAAYVWHQVMDHPREFVMEHAYWGPEYSDSEIKMAIAAVGGELAHDSCVARRIDDEDELCAMVAARISEGLVVGWFQGRMEWGPRALGNRSILADPRRSEMREILNTKIKRRENFRPFAPSIVQEAAGEYFEQSYPSPFMLMAYGVRREKRELIPATTHVDGTGRLQTVNQDQNRRYYKLISEFGRITGIPVLLNTSFNENEPVVCRPEEALECFLRTKMDALAIGNYLLTRENN